MYFSPAVDPIALRGPVPLLSLYTRHEETEGRARYYQFPDLDGWIERALTKRAAVTLVDTLANSNTGGGNVSVDVSGSGVQDGDVILAHGSNVDAASDTSAVISGDNSGNYQEIDETFTDIGAEEIMDVLAYQVQGATPDDTVTVTWTNAANDPTLLQVRIYRGVDNTTPLDQTTPAHTEDTTNDSQPDPPSIVTQTANAVVVAFCAGSSANNDTAGAPTGYGNLEQKLQSQQKNCLIASADKTVASAGTEDPPAFSGYDSASHRSWIARTVALRPAGAGGATGTGDFSVSAPEMSAQGGQTFEGALTAEVSNMELSASGIMLPAGAGDFQAATPSLTASGVQTITGNMDADVAAAVLTAQGFMQPDGTAVFDLSSMVLTAAGAQGATDGVAAVNIAELVLAASGAQIFVGSAPFVIPALTLTTQGYLQPDGITSVEVASASLVASATQIVTGVASPEVQQAVLTASARMEPAGQGDLTVSAPDFEASGALSPIGSASFVIPVLVLNAQGELVGLIWTPTDPETGNWSAVAAKGGVWTPTTPEDGTWTAT